MSPPESYELLENNKARVNTFKSLGQIIDIKDYKILSFFSKINFVKSPSAVSEIDNPCA